jgi:hypothetical protein
MSKDRALTDITDLKNRRILKNTFKNGHQKLRLAVYLL